jgi:hypothetical protein
MRRLSRVLRSTFSKQSEAASGLKANSPTRGIPLRCAVAGLTTILLVCLVACGCRQKGSGEQGSVDNIEQLRKQVAELTVRQQVLAAEYSLAQNPAPYLIVNLSSHSIGLRARGRGLRAFKVVEVDKRSVTATLNSTWALKEKKPFAKSERPKVLPGQGDEAAAEAAKKALWGPDRMPADYDLICDSDRTLEIRSLPSRQDNSRIARWGKSLYRRMVERYRRLTASRNAKSEVRIQLWLSENEAKLLFWSLPKQLEILIVEGISLPEAPSAIPSNPEATSAIPAK